MTLKIAMMGAGCLGTAQQVSELKGSNSQPAFMPLARQFYSYRGNFGR